jgi:hypothetical protein
MKTALLCLLCVVCLLAMGCDVFMPKTTARIVARPYVEPFLATLEAYHKSHNQYPGTLEALRPEHPTLLEGFQSESAGMNGTLYTKLKGQYVDWTLIYKRESQDSYLLGFQRGEADASYRNGKLVSANSNWTR